MATDDAYLRVCRAHNWHRAQLRAHGIEPFSLSPDSPHDPPVGFDFGAPPLEDLVWLERTLVLFCEELQKKYDDRFAGLDLANVRERAIRTVREWRGGRI